MKKVSKFTLALGAALLALGTVHAGIPNNDHPTTFLGPNLQLGYTSTINNFTAYSLAGEAGIRNFRVGGTLGFLIDEHQRIKVSGEYLWQKITYAFFSGNDDVWVNQGAVGAAYEYLFSDLALKPQFDISGYYSHAPNKTDGTVTGTYVTAAGVTSPFTDHRRVAGSDAGGVAPGVSVQAWMGGRVSLALNWDDVTYNTEYSSHKSADGFGGTVELNQELWQDLNLDLTASDRAPFNNYTATLAWTNVQYYGDWTLGIDGAYTTGKKTLPDTWNIGLSADYFLDRRSPQRVSMKGEGGLKGEVTQARNDNFLAWTADPAVYMPQVLAIVDQSSCSGHVTFSGTIPNYALTPGTHPIATASYFSGSNLTYTLAVSGTVPAGDSFHIDPATGVITAVITGAVVDASLTVTAKTSCGSASSNTFVVTRLIP